MAMAQSTKNAFNFSWGSQQSHILNGLKTLAVGEITNVFLTDVTLACEGHYIEAHRLVLSLCSSFFKELFNQNERISDKAHGIVILSHVSAVNLRYILQFMYQGSVQVPQEHVDGFLQTGSMLKVEGLSGKTGVAVGLPVPEKAPRITTTTPTASSVKPKPLPKSSNLLPSVKLIKRRRTSGSGVSGGGSDEDNEGGRHSTRNRVEVNVKKPSLQWVSSTSFADDNNDDNGDPLDSEVVLDDCGDAEGDSDFGDAAPAEVDDSLSGVKVKGTAAALNPPETCTNIQEGHNPGIPKVDDKSLIGGGGRRRNNSSSSSSSDDDDDSSDSSDSTANYVDLPPRRTPMKINYEVNKTFSSLDEAKAYVKGLECWTPHYTRTSLTNETRHNFLCRFVKGCPARLHLLEYGTTIDLYLSTTEHNHPPMPRKRYGMSAEVKAKINHLYRKGMTRPMSLLRALKAAGLEEPTVFQLTGHIRRFRSEHEKNKTNK